MKIFNSQVIIIGSGIAGLYSAIKLAEKKVNVLLITKSNLRESNSRYAQGGIAAVMPENLEDSVELHVQDTLKAGAGLTDESVARFISENSAEVIGDLIKYGVNFDKDYENKIALTLEAAHSIRRILHSGGDSTGRSIELALCSMAEKSPYIKIYRNTAAVDLLVDNSGYCRGVLVFNADRYEYEALFSSAVILASGGVGQVYSNTTNPKIATGDGIALAYRAGAVLQDMEFIQFHPTALNIKDEDTRFLISESVRGEGARLLNSNRQEFTHKYDPRGDLAPRDIVARAIFYEMKATNSNYVYLDTTSIEKERLTNRFPHIIEVCKDNNIDIFNEPIPVSPSAHYIMGGIKINLQGLTSVPNLFAVGEAACSSLHGANRLASNSLLECAVISGETVKYLTDRYLSDEIYIDSDINNVIKQYDNNKEPEDIYTNEALKLLKQQMWQNVGIVRSRAGMEKALKAIDELIVLFNSEYKCSNIEEYEYRNLLTVAKLITQSALAREESRGAHFREDYSYELHEAKHSFIRREKKAGRDVLSSI